MYQQKNPIMDERVQCAWLKYIRLPGVSARTKLLLLDKFASNVPGTVTDPSGIPALSDEELRPFLPRVETLRALRQEVCVEADMRWLEAQDHFLLTWGDKRYPAELREIPDPPLGLYVAGCIDALQGPALGIVGSRRPTPGGMAITRQMAAGISQLGLVIVSGLALGIDGQSHRTALEHGAQTVAVMATGPERVYPARHEKLAGEILAGRGAVGNRAAGRDAAAKDKLPQTKPDHQWSCSRCAGC